MAGIALTNKRQGLYWKAFWINYLKIKQIFILFLETPRKTYDFNKNQLITDSHNFFALSYYSFVI
jgi:hypothetical protein